MRRRLGMISWKIYTSIYHYHQKLLRCNSFVSRHTPDQGSPSLPVELTRGRFEVTKLNLWDFNNNFM